MALEKQDIYSESGRMNPAGHAVAVTPADVDFSWGYTRAIYIGGTGDLKVKMAASGQIVTYVNVQGGMYYPIRAVQIMSGTNATDIIAMY